MPMMKALACIPHRMLLLVFGCLALQPPQQYPHVFNYTGNPLASYTSAADPSAHVFNDTIWVYTSTDANLRDFDHDNGWTYAYMDGYRAFSTTDLKTWTDHGEIFHSSDVSWASSGWMWAPGIASKNGRYYLYFPHRDTNLDWRIGVAIADRPQGPFVDIGQPIQGIAGIDPMVFVDDDGQAYLYCNEHQVAKLKSNMIEIAEKPRNIVYGPKGIEGDYELGFEEGSFMHKRNGVYYFSYSNWRAQNTTAYYAVGDNPYGPFTWQGVLAGATRGSPDHHSIIEFNNESYYFYHMDTPWQDKETLDWYGHRRMACFDQMHYETDGRIRMIQRTYGNKEQLGINAGGGAYTTEDGFVYIADHYHQGSGKTLTWNASVSNTTLGALYQSYRLGDWFQYKIPLENGDFQVTLHFAETYFTGIGSRIFDVDCEGIKIIQNLDIFSLVGKDTAYTEIHNVTVSDELLSIIFSATVDNALVNAIRIDKLAPPSDNGNATIPPEPPSEAPVLTTPPSILLPTGLPLTMPPSVAALTGVPTALPYNSTPSPTVAPSNAPFVTPFPTNTRTNMPTMPPTPTTAPSNASFVTPVPTNSGTNIPTMPPTPIQTEQFSYGPNEDANETMIGKQSSAALVRHLHLAILALPLCILHT